MNTVKKLLKPIKICAVCLFIAAETAIYFTFMFADIPADDVTALKYAGVILCALFTLGFCANLKLNNFILFAALIFTAISDWFLLVDDEYMQVGLITFIIAQLLHFARIYTMRKKPPYVSAAARAALCVITLIVLNFTIELNLLTALAAVYFINLLANFADSLALVKKDKFYLLYALGLLLFIGCDVCVGAYNLSFATGLNLPQSFVNFADKGMWAFYLPSQTLIALSGVKNEK